MKYIVLVDMTNEKYPEVNVENRVEQDIPKNQPLSSHYLQIDILKAVAIIMVILLHSLSLAFQELIFYRFHLILAVPIFCIIMGLTAALSHKKYDYKMLNQLYSRDYFTRKFKRYIIPFIIIFVISGFLAWLVLTKDLGAIVSNNIPSERFSYRFTEPFYYIFGYLPLSGYGNYFLTIIFAFIFIGPLLYRIFLFNPKVMIILCFVFEIIFLIIISLPFKLGYYYYFLISLRYLSFFGLGLYISANTNLFSKSNLFILIGLPVSILCIISFRYGLFGLTKIFNGNLSMISFPISFYVCFIVLLFFKLIPSVSDKRIYNFIANIGKRSYHIFLVQILFFGSGYSFGNILIILGTYNHLDEISFNLFVGLLFIMTELISQNYSEF